ncbi:MAG: DUF6770 family protein, partial [Ginsengibacter sp.]
MKKHLLFLLLGLSFCATHAQTKIFKEVSDDIATQTRAILQDNALVGYVVFTRLEKVNEDSFNYKISLMDENLNDIGTVNFREIGLDLGGVAFDQDVLCLAYLKSNTQGKTFKTKKQARKIELQDDVITQFLTLNGQIVKTNSIPVNLKSIIVDNGIGWANRSIEYSGSLKHRIQLKNITGKGFACFYGDGNGCNLITYDFKGNQLWRKSIDDKQDFALLASKADVYLLEKEKIKYVEGGGSLTGFNFNDGKSYPKIAMQDKDGRSLTLLNFDNDPVTGNPYICGNIIDKNNGNRINDVGGFTKGPYAGVYTIDINGHTKNDIKQTFTYWNDGSQKPEISTKGYINNTKAYNLISHAFRDYSGNTYFVCSQLTKKVRVGAIVGSVLTLPTLIGPLLFLAPGGSKCKLVDANVMKLSTSGTLSLENTIPCVKTSYVKVATGSEYLRYNRRYYSLDNPGSKSSYVIADDMKNIMIYNVNQGKVVRTIPHKKG